MARTIGTSRSRPVVVIVMMAVAVIASWDSGADPATASSVAVPYTCDLPAPAGVSGIYVGAVGDTVPATLQVDRPGGSVIAGQPYHAVLATAIPTLANGLPRPPDVPFTPTYGYLYVKSVDITQALPAGLVEDSVTVTADPAPAWLQVSRSGGTVTAHVQSTVAGSYLRIDLEAVSPVIEIETSPGTWAPLTGSVGVVIDGTVQPSGHTAVEWKAPSLTMVVKYVNSIYAPFLTINWVDLPVPCTPDDPEQVVVSQTIDPVVRRPDGRISRGTGPAVGDDLYNTTGVGQTRTGTVGRTGSVTYRITAQNDGNVTDGIRVKGQGSTTRFRVRYLTQAGADVTAAVTAGTHTFAGVGPGQTRTLRMVVSAKTGTVRGQTATRSVTLSSAAAATTKDVVRATTTRA